MQSSSRKNGDTEYASLMVFDAKEENEIHSSGMGI
jgi:hypothetical protein